MTSRRTRFSYASPSMQHSKKHFELHKEAPTPPKPLPFAELTKNWNDSIPMVSVLCSTYQHYSFIRDTLDGFFSQVTSFPFEVIVRDDASTDGTQDILREFAASYPGVLRLILEQENRWDIERPLLPLLDAARGDLIALCEGDDYWFDPHRLQRLFDAMMVNPSASLIEDGAVVIEDGLNVAFLPPGDGGLRTWLLRSNIFDLNAIRRNQFRILTGDKFIHAMAEISGEIVRQSSYSTVYRLHPGSLWTGGLRTDKNLIEVQDVSSRIWISLFLSEKGKKEKSLLYVAQSIDVLLNFHPIQPNRILVRVIRGRLHRFVLEKLRSGRRFLVGLLRLGKFHKIMRQIS